jgi:hypothetical protein
MSTDSISHVYETVGGSIIQLKPISSRVRDALSAQWVEPAKPTYTIQVAGGETEVHDHDESTLETEEDKAKWQQYLDTVIAANRKFSELVYTTYIRFGTNYRDFKPTDDSWLRDQQSIGIEVPDDPEEQQLHYFRTEILSSDVDMRNIIDNVRELSMSGRMLVKVAEDSFRNQVAGVGDNPGQRSENSEMDRTAGPEDTSGQMDSL